MHENSLLRHRISHFHCGLHIGFHRSREPRIYFTLGAAPNFRNPVALSRAEVHQRTREVTY